MLGITPVYLDGGYYDRDWRPLEKEQFAALQRDLVAAPRWIIAGNFGTGVASCARMLVEVRSLWMYLLFEVL